VPHEAACQLGGGTLTRLKTFAMSLGFRLSDLLALGLKLKALFFHPTFRRFKRLSHYFSCSLRIL
jgi:hypothetical protein